MISNDLGCLQPIAFEKKYLRDAFCSLVPFAQIKKREKHPQRSVTFSGVADWSRFIRNWGNVCYCKSGPQLLQVGVAFKIKNRGRTITNQDGYYKLEQFLLHKKWSFPLRISSVNVTKSAVSCWCRTHIRLFGLID